MTNKQIAQRKTKPLEQNQRLSKSILWKLQRDFFERSGIDAWRKGTVPHHITCNASIADAYARVVLGFLRDCQTAQSQALSIDAEPLYLVELGSGSGRFGYLLLKKLQSLCQKSGLKEIPIKYVMTDVVEKNLLYWQEHEWLKPFVEQQILDFALLDAERDYDKIELMNSKAALSAETIRRPIVLIANYVFDGISQDAFCIHEGKLYESLITLSPDQNDANLNDPTILSHLGVSYQNHVAEESYYDDPAWNRILQEYKRRLPEAPFLFPTAALRCIQSFHRISNGNMLLMSADKGYHRDEEILLGRGAPGIVIHGSFSMNVDYQIIGEYVGHLGGQTLHPAHQHRSLNISAFLFGQSASDFAETKLAYEESIERFGPDDLATLGDGIAKNYDSLSFDEIVALLRLSGWDYRRFWDCLPFLKQFLEEINQGQKKELYTAILKTWEAYLPIGEDQDLAFQLGTLLLEMDYYEESLRFLQHSIELHGIEPGTAYNIAVCYFSLRKMDEALSYVDEALELDPEFDAAKELRINIQSAC